MKMEKILYWVSTLVMCGVFAFSASMYFMNTEMVKGFFEALGYPTYLVIPLAILKILGIIAILSRKSKLLTEWAYAGFFFDAALAFTAHIVAKDDQALFSIIVLIALVVSRYMYGRLYPN